MTPVIDEARKLVTVMEIRDNTHFIGAWRGNVFECRELPGGQLSVGDVAFCHVLPHSTELVAIIHPEQELWFSPGYIDIGGGDWRGQLWKMTSPTAVPQFVLQTDSDQEFTHLFWCQIDNNLYACTHDWNTQISRVFRVNRAAGTMALVDQAAGSDTIVGAAEFGTLVFLMAGGYEAQELGYLFDPVAGTLNLAIDFQAVFGDFEWGSACAYDPIEARLVGIPGDVARWSINGLAWNLDIDLNLNFQTFGIFDAMVNRHDDDDVYCCGRDINAPQNAAVLRRTATGVWVIDMAQPGWATGTSALTSEQPGPATAGAMYVQRWGWTAAESPEIYRRPVAGAWGLDWAGPGVAWKGMGHQGVVWFQDRLMALMGVAFGSTTRLYRRNAAGNYTLIQQWPNHWPVATNAESLAMCVAPNTMRKCHEC